MELTQTLQDQSGLGWVLARLTPLSPFGVSGARALPWYAPGQEEELALELANVAQAKELWQTPSPALRGVTRVLPCFRDIRGSLDRTPGVPFDLTELFELKHFCLTVEQLAQAYGQMPPFAQIALPPVGKLLEVLDPSGRRLSTFSIEDGYHPHLPAIRQRKEAVEQAIRGATQEEKNQLLGARSAIAQEESQVELAVRTTLTAAILAQKDVLEHSIAAITRLDLTLAKGLLAKRYHCTCPTLVAEDTLTLKGLIHPEVREQVEGRGEGFCAVDITLTRGCTVITGANMGGKYGGTAWGGFAYSIMSDGLFPLRRGGHSPSLCPCGTDFDPGGAW